MDALMSCYRSRTKVFLFPAFLVLFVCPVPLFPMDREGDKSIPRFESKIVPIFEANCLICHGEKAKQAGLDLRSRDGLLKGGISGPAVVPGSASESLLMEKVFSGAMPMGGEKLSAQEIELVRQWIDAGALKEGETAADVGKLPQGLQVTEREVMATILHVRCVVCHGRRQQQAGLDLRTTASLLKGGKSGPAILPGKPDESLLVQRIEAGEMPPPDPEILREYALRPVTSDDLEKIRRWIAAGAPAEPGVVANAEQANGQGTLVSEEDRKFWSFQPPKRPSVPKVRDQDRVRTPIDAFLLRKLEAKGLGFSPEADRLVLMRRAYFDLIGIPASPEEVEAYRKDPSPLAYERLIDRLLASSHYGERWARHWLDAVGYSDSEGKVEDDLVRYNAYRYRDYVIRSLNDDKPYDRFLSEQIAGDEMFDYKAAKQLTPDQMDKLVATGFLRTAPDGTYSLAQNKVSDRLNVLADQVEIFSSAVMGLTMACARCHSHKYDPIPQRDYYRLSAIFRTGYDPFDWFFPNRKIDGSKDKLVFPMRLLDGVPKEEHRQVEVGNAPVREEIERLQRSLEEKARPLRKKLFEEKLAKLPDGVKADVRRALSIPGDQRRPVEKYLAGKFEPALKVGQKELENRFEDFKEQSKPIKRAIAEAERKLQPKPMIRALFDVGGEPTPTYVLGRGEYFNPGPLAPPGVPAALGDGLSPYKVVKPSWATGTSGRRLALARWLAQPNHPLTSRVLVNRLWQHHFGTGLVASGGNFGKTGSPPTHPELLDWLATEFVRGGWRLKAIHKLILTSTAYRQGSSVDAERHAADPDNTLLSRFPMLRLDAEMIRDSILKVAGRLDTTPFGPAQKVEVRPDGEVVGQCSPAGCRRSIYMLQRRTTPVTMLDAFDLPQLNPNCLHRAHSTVSSQALTMMNSDGVRTHARHMAGRVIDAVGAEVDKQIERVYLSALSRPPSTEEVKAARETLLDLTRHWREHLEKEVPAEPKGAKAGWLALATLCHMVLNSAEFIYLD